MERLTPNSQIAGIPAATWNQFADTKKKVDQLLQRVNQLSSRSVSALRVQVENATGVDITADFPVLAIGTPVVNSNDRENCIYEGVQFVGTTPDSGTSTFGVVQGPILTGTFRVAVFQGLTWCRVNVTADSHTKAHPTTTSEYLVSGTTGVPILWRELQDSEGDTTGEQWALVLIGGGSGDGGPDIRYVLVVDINEGPDDEDDFSDPYQPVLVKELSFQDYAPATSGTVSTDNSDIEVATTKGHKKHGSRGNGISATLAIDGVITPDAEASFDDSTDLLAIKIKNDAVLWSAVSAAVALVLDGAFSLTAEAPTAEVGSGSITIPDLSGGVDGGFAVSGNQFAIGGPETAAQVRIGQHRDIILNESSGRYELIEWKAEERYVEVYNILVDPEGAGEEGGPPERYQRVICKELTWSAYKPATSGTVDGGNTHFVISAHKGSRFHGVRGNSIGVTFEIDSGITGQAESDFTEASDPDPAVLNVKVKDDTVTWADVQDAVRSPVAGGLLINAFSLIADDQTAEVGASIGSVTATLSGGEDGDWSVLDEQFGVGDHDLADDVDLGDRFHVVWNGAAQRWEVIRSEGSEGGGALLFMVVEVSIDAASGTVGEIVAGFGSAIQYDINQEPVRRTPTADSVTVYNFDPFKSYPANTGIYVATTRQSDGSFIYEVVSANCQTYMPDDEE